MLINSEIRENFRYSNHAPVEIKKSREEEKKQNDVSLR